MTNSITIRVDSEVKAEAQSLFEDLGLDMTTALTMFLKKAIAVNGIPFSVSKSIPNKETLQAMDDAEHMRNLSGPYKTIEEMKAALDA